MITPVTPARPPCARPAEAFDIDDYNGPLSHLVSRFSQSIESTTVHIPRHRSDLRPCALTASDKFHMFVESTADPSTIWARPGTLPPHRWTAMIPPTARELRAMENGSAQRLRTMSLAISSASFFIHLSSGRTRATTAWDRVRAGAAWPCSGPSVCNSRRLRQTHAELLRVVWDREFQGAQQSLSSGKPARIWSYR